MIDQILLNIADLQISINSSQLPILQEQDQAYRAFEGDRSNRKTLPDIEVDLQLGESPEVCGWKKIFEDEESWSVYRCENEYLMCFTPARHGKDPLWIARFQKDCNHVVVHCSGKLVNRRNGNPYVVNPVRYPLDQHLIMYHLAGAKGALIHAAGLCFRGEGLIFPGCSGAGKSTLTRLLSENEEWQGLSDDRMLIRKMERSIRCYGTPWPGEEGIACNLDASLSGMFFLCHGSDNSVKELTPPEALKRLLPVVSIPWYDQDTCVCILQFCDDLISQVPIYELCFKPTVEIVDFFEEHFKSGFY